MIRIAKGDRAYCEAFIQSLKARVSENDRSVEDKVAEILKDVRDNGDEAVRRYTMKFDGWAPEKAEITKEEIDALTTMGISRYVRLVLPKVVALTLAMPLVTLWGSSMALFGGMVSANLQLGLSFDFFLNALPRAVPAVNLLIGLSKGAVFGLLIALVACHFGLRVRPNTESLSANTTASVVSSITVVILVDAVFAIATRSIGLPR